jgi:competence protein ComGC
MIETLIVLFVVSGLLLVRLSLIGDRTNNQTDYNVTYTCNGKVIDGQLQKR